MALWLAPPASCSWWRAGGSAAGKREVRCEWRDSAISRRKTPEPCKTLYQEGAGNAGCIAAPAASRAKSGSTRASHHRQADAVRRFLRDGVTASFALLCLGNLPECANG